MFPMLSSLFLAILFAEVNCFSIRSSASESRRAFLDNIIATTTTGALLTSIIIPQPAEAIGGKSKVNNKLLGFGLPPALIPDGLTPVCHIYGTGKNRFPILVTFSHPFDWVVTLPNNDSNGEDGTIQAGEYGKGDTATFFVYDQVGNVKDIESQDKSFFERAIIAAISQKGSNVYQNFKITNITPAKGEYRNQQYMIVDFRYELLTGAGFEVDRRGVASVTSEGAAVEVLWTATTRQRFKKLEPTLRDIAGSFRCYTDGLNFSEELMA